MSGITQINYEDALAGKIARRLVYDPIGAWFVAQGATYRSNKFVDPELQLGQDHFANIIKIIRSARNQNHDGIEIRLTPDSFTAISSRVAEIAALENADLTSHFYGEHRGKETLIVRFRERHADWLLEAARSTLTGDEYEELQKLVKTRLRRCEREIALTEKALAKRQ